VLVEWHAKQRRAFLNVLPADGGGERLCFSFFRTLLADMPTSFSGLT
jgi:hypothetical protein